jgi:hypothetical protein
VPGSRIDQSVDPLAHRQLAALALSLDTFRAAHLARKSLAALDLADFLFPGHFLFPPQSLLRSW